MSDQILPTESKSYWRANNDFPLFSKINNNIETDIVIIGAGLTGITAAYLLSNSGRKVIVVEGSRILEGTTGFTTAKVTAQHGPIYQQLISTFGEEKARLYYDANTEAKEYIKQTIEQLNIHCDYETMPAYIYADTDVGIEKVEKEMEAYNTLGIEGASLQRIQDFLIQ